MNIIGIIGLIILALCLLVASPFLTIASLNTLFGLNIGYTVWTWLSVAWMNFTTFGGLGLTIRSLKK